MRLEGLRVDQKSQEQTLSPVLLMTRGEECKLHGNNLTRIHKSWRGWDCGLEGADAKYHVAWMCGNCGAINLRLSNERTFAH